MVLGSMRCVPCGRGPPCGYRVEHEPPCASFRHEQRIAARHSATSVPWSRKEVICKEIPSRSGTFNSLLLPDRARSTTDDERSGARFRQHPCDHLRRFAPALHRVVLGVAGQREGSVRKGSRPGHQRTRDVQRRSAKMCRSLVVQGWDGRFVFKTCEEQHKMNAKARSDLASVGHHPGQKCTYDEGEHPNVRVRPRGSMNYTLDPVVRRSAMVVIRPRPPR